MVRKVHACNDDGMHESQALAAALNQTLASHAPGWTNHNEADPGVTILEVMAWLAEGLVYRGRIEAVHQRRSAR